MLSPNVAISAGYFRSEEENSATPNFSSTALSISDGDSIGNTSNILEGKANDGRDEDEEAKNKKKRESVMNFLRKTGRVGGVKDFSTAMGVDEGPVGQTKNGVGEIEKGRNAYKLCTETGIIDDMSESLPRTSSGTEWSGFTDKVMGGVSIGKVIREVVDGRNADVMKGKVSLYNNGGFIQMATSLSTDPSVSLSVDASSYDGIELEVLYRGDEDTEKFNVHLRNAACRRQTSSY